MANGRTLQRAVYLHVRASRDSLSFLGSYPYSNRGPEKGTRLDSFLLFSNNPKAMVHQTPTNHGD